jgi:hypothetical protein
VQVSHDGIDGLPADDDGAQTAVVLAPILKMNSIMRPTGLAAIVPRFPRFAAERANLPWAA